MKEKDKFEIAANAVHGQPEDSFEQTYNIQPTNDADREFPAISQGLPKKHHRNIEAKE